MRVPSEHEHLKSDEQLRKMLEEEMKGEGSAIIRLQPRLLHRQ